jgi:hypothetical protein
LFHNYSLQIQNSEESVATSAPNPKTKKNTSPEQHTSVASIIDFFSSVIVHIEEPDLQEFPAHAISL